MDTNKPLILFDFDGTLAETMTLILTVFNRLSPLYGYRKLPEEELEAHRHMTVQEFIREFKIPFWKVPLIALHARHLMHKSMHEIQPPNGLVDVLSRIHESGRYQMEILTSNHRENVLRFLTEHSMGWFDDVLATRSILCKKKRVMKYIRSRKINPQNLYYVGDTTIDVNSARLAGARTVAVTWGLNSSELLSSFSPDFLIDDPRQLLEIFPLEAHASQ